jgi:hypothetical protein
MCSWFVLRAQNLLAAGLLTPASLPALIAALAAANNQAPSGAGAANGGLNGALHGPIDQSAGLAGLGMAAAPQLQGSAAGRYLAGLGGLPGGGQVGLYASGASHAGLAGNLSQINSSLLQVYFGTALMALVCIHPACAAHLFYCMQLHSRLPAGMIQY